MKRYIDALKRFILFSAITHIILLIIKFIATRNLNIINYFNILDIDLFIPGVVQSQMSQVLSPIVMVGIYLVILKYFAKP
ncbi:MAG: hypothetical protein FD145_764 [Candidatus Saganbacteria bacterium]|uniref:Uncharacterized protein n=1 Tax=Candidatus Saganbacteria bacterium TaxID=2575572 RepID=A0A833P376_UNCSA|nr:MAG: hypothetical protein FD145_764 [Candidatus Saganbacteria bacterium]